MSHALQGLEEYIKLGAGPLKNKALLTTATLLQRALIYHTYHDRERTSCDLDQVLLRMVQSGMYFPAANWVIPFQGKGMPLPRAAAAWKMMIAPQTVTLHDIHLVFFYEDEHTAASRVGVSLNTGQRYFNTPGSNEHAAREGLPPYGPAPVPQPPSTWVHVDTNGNRMSMANQITTNVRMRPGSTPPKVPVRALDGDYVPFGDDDAAF